MGGSHSEMAQRDRLQLNFLHFGTREPRGSWCLSPFVMMTTENKPKPAVLTMDKGASLAALASAIGAGCGLAVWAAG